MSFLIYQAGPLFTESEKGWHRKLSQRLRAAGHQVVWPGDLLSDAQIAAASAQAGRLIFNSCKQALERCCAAGAGAACLVALLDGPQVDDGTAWEIGYAHARGLSVFGIRTDSRQAGETPHSRVNSMIEHCLAGLADDADGLLELLQKAATPTF